MRHDRTIGAVISAGLALLAANVIAGPAPAAGVDKACLSIQATLATDFVPRAALQDWKSALPCLQDYIAGLATFHSRDEAINALRNPDYSATVTKGATALRSILDDIGDPAIALFRRRQTLAEISVLALSAISETREARLSATLVLGNVIDETTICVPEDYLYYSDISDNGRANLLALVSIPVQFVNASEMKNITNVLNYLDTPKLDSLFDTQRIVQSIRDKVDAFSTRATNTVPPNFSALCGQYQPLFAPDGMLFNPT